MRVVNEREAAAIIGHSVSWLRQTRVKKSRTEGPPYLKIGRSVRYDIDDLRRWLDDHRVDPAAQDREADLR